MTVIAWRPWGEEVFAEAQQKNKPVLLSLSAPFCRFCEAMDEQTYGNEAIARYVEENFLPVRVDTDKRPDVATRYGQGGWPSTLILTGEGDIIWGGTFVPFDQMTQLLPQVLNEFHNNRQNVNQHVARLREQIRQQNTPPPLDKNIQITPGITQLVLLNVKHNFDLAFGGFGHNGQKFPHVEVMELLLEQYEKSVLAGTPDFEIRLMLEKSLHGVADGALQDSEGVGGFFRYTQTPDWREPQVEKTLEDSSLLTRLYSRAYQLLENDKWRATAEKTLGYLSNTLYDSTQGTWGGSQFADAEYYAQPIAERLEWNPPTVDATVYAGANSLAIRANIAWWQATGDTEALAKAKRALDFLLGNLLQPDGAVQHFLPATEEDAAAAGRIPTGLLADAADLTAACLDAYEAGLGATYLERGEDIAIWVRGHLEDPRGGGLFDAVVRPDAVGNLKVGTKDIPDNMQMADALLRLYLTTGEEEHAQLARRIMQAFTPILPQIAFHASGFALAAERSMTMPVIVHIVGPAGNPQTQALLAAAHAPYRFERIVQPLDPADPSDAEQINDLGYATTSDPVAYVRIGESDPQSITDPAALTEAVKTGK